MLSNSTDAKKPTWNLSMRLKPMKSFALLCVNFEFQSSSGRWEWDLSETICSLYEYNSYHSTGHGKLL